MANVLPPLIGQIKDPMISIKGLNFSYGKKNKKVDHKKVFSDLDFELGCK